MTVVMFTQSLLLPGQAALEYPYRNVQEYFAAVNQQKRIRVRAGETVVGYVEDFRIDGNKVLGTFSVAEES